MEASPLKQSSRPTSFQPKIAGLYDELFKEEEDSAISDGFWREFFILKPDRSRLQGKLENLSATDLLHLQVLRQNSDVDCKTLIIGSMRRNNYSGRQ